MLVHIASVYGGSVTTVTTSNGTFVLWVINHSHTILTSILPLFAQFPPLTTRMQLQLAFMLHALEGMSMDTYFTMRGEKYNARHQISPIFAMLPQYFTS
jgi:hypothetical protein